PTARADTFADGMACRDPQPEPLAIVRAGAARVLEVEEDEIAEAMRMLYGATHNVAEGAGAAALAALMQERSTLAGRAAGVVLCGGNVDRGTFAQVLGGGTPEP
ncbi:MAG: pyridoxal-phosphate dependent enzyme, partial [Pseudomonadales bacterium]|nr:pyridoxal-phosphate dependent enzyme [Pseudomonadales bacterium]